MKTSSFAMFVLMSLVPLAPSGCANLSAIEDEGCGNHVVNEDEDCDRPDTVEDGLTCGLRNTANACFFECDPAVSPPSCPDGWGCGNDRRCRRPSGKFDGRAGPSMAVDQFAVSDVDGDGAPDIMGSAGPQVSVRYGDGKGMFNDGFDQSVPQPTGAIAFGQFTTDTRLDMVAPADVGFFSLLGTPERTLEPYNYAPFTLPFMPDKGRLVIVEADAGEPFFNPTEALLFLDSDFGFISFHDSLGMRTTTPEGLDASLLTQELPRADLDGDALTELVLLYRGHDRTYTFKASSDPTPTPIGYRMSNLPIGMDNQVLLPVGYMITEPGGLFADVDNDGDLDLLVAVMRADGSPGVAVSHQTNGLFQGYATIDDLFCERGYYPGECMDRPWPLAAADFNGDGFTDYVFSDGIGMASYDPMVPGAAPNVLDVFNSPTGDTEWDHAVLVDINADSALDVVAASAESPGVDVFLNTILAQEILFNPFHVTSALPTKALRVGDFDGDLLADVAFVEDGSSRRVSDRLSVIFGAYSSGPTDAVDMGALGILVSIDSGSLLAGLNGPDAIRDLLFLRRPWTLLRDAPIAAAVMFGDASRKLLSPFLMSTADDEYYPAATLMSDFGHPGVLMGPDATDVLVVFSHEDNTTAGFLVMAAGVGGLGNTYAQLDYIARLPDSQYFNGACALWTAGPLGDGARDALVGVDFGGPDCGDSGAFTPRLLVARDLDRTLLPDGPPPMTPETDFDPDAAPDLPVVLTDLPYETSDVRRLELVDLDADGARDLLVVLSGADDAGLVLVLWNSDACGDDRLCPQSVTELLVSDIEDLGFDLILDAVPIQLDTDVLPELAVLTDQGVIALDLDPESDVYGEQVWLLRSTNLDPDETGTIRAVDVDGDGLQDLVFNTEGRLRIGLQVPDKTLGLEYVEDAQGDDNSADVDAGAGAP